MNIIAEKANFYFVKNHHEEDEFLCHYLKNLFHHRYMIVLYQLFNCHIKRRLKNAKSK